MKPAVSFNRQALEQRVQDIFDALGLRQVSSLERAAVFHQLHALLEGETLRCSRLAVALALDPKEVTQRGVLALAERIRSGAPDPTGESARRRPRCDVPTAPFFPPRPSTRPAAPRAASRSGTELFHAARRRDSGERR